MRNIAVISLLVLMMVGIPYADERCSESRNVSYGDSMKEVLSKCGQPVKLIYYYNALNQRVGQEFMYNLADGKFPRYFYFDQTGRVTRMSIGEKRQ